MCAAHDGVDALRIVASCNPRCAVHVVPITRIEPHTIDRSVIGSDCDLVLRCVDEFVALTEVVPSTWWTFSITVRLINHRRDHTVALGAEIFLFRNIREATRALDANAPRAPVRSADVVQRPGIRAEQSARGGVRSDAGVARGRQDVARARFAHFEQVRRACRMTVYQTQGEKKNRAIPFCYEWRHRYCGAVTHVGPSRRVRSPACWRC